MVLSEDAAVKNYDLLAHKFAHRYAGRNEYEDIYQAARLGIVEAARTFDESKGASFSTHAFNMALKAIRRMMRKDTGIIYIPAHADAEPELFPAPQRTEWPLPGQEPFDVHDYTGMTIQKTIIYEVIESLSEKHRKVAFLKLVYGLSITEIAEKLQCSNQNASAIWVVAQARIKHALVSQGLTFDTLMGK